jgi:uncharacterized membrane-anchored protein
MIKFHPQHIELHQEIHARPYPTIEAPAVVSHLAFLHNGNAIEVEYAAINELAGHFQVNGITPGRTGYFEDFGLFLFRWENHREFSTITIIRKLDSDSVIPGDVCDLIPTDWFSTFPGEVISATNLVICSKTKESQIKNYVGTKPVIVTELIDQQFTLWTALQMDAEGFTRFVLKQNSNGKFQLGRVVLKILEIETYRQMSLLSLPIAKQIASKATVMSNSCASILDRMAHVTIPNEESELLQELTNLAAEVERLRAFSSYRFSATKAYSELVNSRIEELEQTRVSGKEIFGDFLLRRFMPAVRTCEAVQFQLENLSKRFTRVSDLLRTRVEQTIAEQNQKLLESMNRKSQLQLRLQQTVEGLSVAAITYYLIGLLKIVLHGANGGMFNFNENLVLAVSVPFVLLTIFALVRRVKKKLLV